MNQAVYERLLAMVNKPVNVYCRECGCEMVMRQNRLDRDFFLGCHRFPACTWTEPLPESLLMQAAGQQELFK